MTILKRAVCHMRKLNNNHITANDYYIMTYFKRLNYIYGVAVI